MTIPTYVFDIDETLLHTRNTPVHGNSIAINVDGETLYVHIRPAARSLLMELLKMQAANILRVGVWTAATKRYAEKVLKVLLGTRGLRNLSFIYTRANCDQVPSRDGQPRYIKPLIKYFPRSRRVVLLDDNGDNIKINHSMGYTVIHVPAFYGRNNDRELHKIQTSLLSTGAVRKMLRGSAV